MHVSQACASGLQQGYKETEGLRNQSRLQGADSPSQMAVGLVSLDNRAEGAL